MRKRKFDSATLAVSAFPCTMGGKLKIARAEDKERIEVTMLKEELITTVKDPDMPDQPITVFKPGKVAIGTRPVVE